jgi:hypothetical protein
MPTFDIVSEIDMHELTNAIDNSNRAVSQRFDLKGTNTKVEKSKDAIVLISESDFQIEQLLDIVHKELVRRDIDIRSLEAGAIKPNGKLVEQQLTIKQGLDKDTTKKIVKLIKDNKLKVQATIQGDQVRVTGKKRDDLQMVISMLKNAEIGVPLQFNNFRD